MYSDLSCLSEKLFWLLSRSEIGKIGHGEANPQDGYRNQGKI